MLIDISIIMPKAAAQLVGYNDVSCYTLGLS
jgi:hypothetical protein